MNFWEATSLQFELLVSAIRRKPGVVFQDWGGVAIRGYDPVAYFSQQRPMKGNPAITAKWNGASWHFVSEGSKMLFMQSPEMYAPQFGGFCAMGVHNGYKIHTQPDAWYLHEGKLYLNYNISIQKRWLADLNNHLKQAVENWARLKKRY